MTSLLLGKLDMSNQNLSQDREYLLSIPRQKEEYDEFGQGFWQNVSLMNSTGDSDDSQYKNGGSAKSTPHLYRCPGIRNLVESVFDVASLRMLRARNLIDGLVIPHRDFIELEREHTYCRVFLPLEDNKYAFHSDDGGVFNMRLGEIWMLDATVDHAAVNFSNQSRLFLCLDFAYDRELADRDIFVRTEKMSFKIHANYVKRPPLPEQMRRSIIASTAAVLNRDNFKDHLFALSKYHFRYRIGVAECYEWLIQATELTRNAALIEKARALDRYLTKERALGERFNINAF